MAVEPLSGRDPAAVARLGGGGGGGGRWDLPHYVTAAAAAELEFRRKEQMGMSGWDKSWELGRGLRSEKQ